MSTIIYFVYIFILFLSFLALRTANVRVASWQYFAITLGIAGAYLCGYFHAAY